MPESDLWLLDLHAGEFRKLSELNSNDVDSYASWSSDPHWVVFNSKRIDGVFSRPYFSFLREDGRFTKPFLMPQEDPFFYDGFIKNYNRPELVTGPVMVRPGQWVGALFEPEDRRVPGGGESSGAESDHPYEGTVPSQ
jgi:hypothetical protein